MATLQIRKKSLNVWEHIASDAEDFFISKLYIKRDGRIFKIVEEGGSNRKKYDFSDITIFDDELGTGPETFANPTTLELRLEALRYPGFLRPGEVSAADLISPLPGNQAVIIGGLIFVNANSGTGAMPNELIYVGEITRNGNEFTIPQSALWRINGVSHTNVADFTVEIEETEEGVNRIDIIVANENSTFELIQGVPVTVAPTGAIAQSPLVPINTLLVTSFNVYGSDVTLDLPIMNSPYVTKLSKGSVPVFGGGVIENLQRQHKTKYILKGVNTEIQGLTNSIVNIFSDHSYANQELTFKNESGTDAVLKHLHANGEIKFFLPSANDLILENGYTARFDFNQDTNTLDFVGVSFGGSDSGVKWFSKHENLTGTTISVPAGFEGSISNLDAPQKKVTFVVAGTTATISDGADSGDYLHTFGLQPNI